MTTRKVALIHGILILVSSTTAFAQLTVTSDRGDFAIKFPSQMREGFESIMPGTNAPFVTPGLVVEGDDFFSAPQVIDNLAGLPHSFWFQGISSPENFILANTYGLVFSWYEPVIAAGLDVQCFACDSEGSPSLFRFDAYRVDGSPLGTADLAVELNGTLRFFGVRSSEAFGRLIVTRIMEGGGFGNYVADDLRSVTDRIFTTGFE